jgi:hypothetical protein
VWLKDEYFNPIYNQKLESKYTNILEREAARKGVLASMLRHIAKLVLAME